MDNRLFVVTHVKRFGTPFVLSFFLLGCSSETTASASETTTVTPDSTSSTSSDSTSEPSAGPDIFCGNGIREGNEECDDGNQLNTDDCSTLCLLATCGDGFVHSGQEACDDGNNIENDACTSACQPPPVCGDGITQIGEDCDDTNLIDNDECTNQCTFCGNGTIQEGESCDDGNDDDNDGCRNDCTKCGDGIVDLTEECDDKNTDNTDACPETCQFATCGDGFVEAGEEECDLGHDTNEMSLCPHCKHAFCGDGFTASELGEECDDANNSPNDGCYQCKDECGNGVVDEGEVCDFGTSGNNMENEEHHGTCTDCTQFECSEDYASCEDYPDNPSCETQIPPNQDPGCVCPCQLPDIECCMDGVCAVNNC